MLFLKKKKKDLQRNDNIVGRSNKRYSYELSKCDIDGN